MRQTGEAHQLNRRYLLGRIGAYHETHKADENGRVIDVKLEGRQVDDLALDQVKNLSELRVLSLFGSSVTDAGVAKLSGLKYLDSLGLGKTPVTDHGLVYLEKMPCLHYLCSMKIRRSRIRRSRI